MSLDFDPGRSGHKDEPMWSNDGWIRIANERSRQIGKEGWTAEHDDAHDRGELADAAGCYVALAAVQAQMPTIAQDFDPPKNPPGDWPWSEGWWKPSRDPIRNLEKAGALIAAEIDRLERAGAVSRGES